MTTIRVGNTDLTFAELAGPTDPTTITLEEFKAKLASLGLSDKLLTDLFGSYEGDDEKINSTEFATLCNTLDAYHAQSGGIAGKADIEDFRFWFLSHMANSSSGPAAGGLTEDQFISHMQGMGLTANELKGLFQFYSGGNGKIDAAECGTLLNAVKQFTGGASSCSAALKTVYILTKCAYAESDYFSGAVGSVANLDAQVQQLLDKMKSGAGANLSETVAISTELGVINSRLSSVLSIIADMKQMLKDAANPR